MNKTHIEITKGLDLPIEGAPDQSVTDAKNVEFCALLGSDYHGLKPSLAVQEGDKVHKGSPLLVSKSDTKVVYTAPASGKVVAINRGHRRALVSVVIATDGKDTQVDFKPSQQQDVNEIADVLQTSGLWTALRTRPFSKVPLSSERPATIFINAMANDSYAANPDIFLNDHLEGFINGAKVLARLAEKKVFICCSPDSQLLDVEYQENKVTSASFSGKYPASLTGTHMHFLYPAGRTATNFWINYQDVAAIGKLFSDGEIMNQRLLGLGGPVVNKPRLLLTSLGANIQELTKNELGEKLQSNNNRLISGGILNGRACTDDTDSFCGRYHLQLAALDQGNQREFMGWLSWGLNKFSNQGIYLSKLFPNKLLNLNSSTNGSERAMVPMSTYEKVMPLNLLATQLLRSVLVGDIEMAERLGCLELDEEDLALCSFVCPGKYEYGEALRHNLERIEKENWNI